MPERRVGPELEVAIAKVDPMELSDGYSEMESEFNRLNQCCQPRGALGGIGDSVRRLGPGEAYTRGGDGAGKMIAKEAESKDLTNIRRDARYGGVAS